MSELTPITRTENFLARIAGDDAPAIEPITRIEHFLQNIVDTNAGGGLSTDTKYALIACFEKVAWVDEHGQDYVDALRSALFPPASLDSISAVYTQSGTVYTTDSLDSLKADLVVTATYSDGSTAVIPAVGYTLSGTLVDGTNTITVSFGGQTTTFTVVATSILFEITNYSVNRTDAPAVDTGIKLLETDSDFCIVFDGIQGSIPSGVAYRPLFCAAEETNWKGVFWGAGSSATYAGIQYMNISAATMDITAFTRSSTSRFRLIYQHTANSGGASIYAKVGDDSLITKTPTDTFLTHSATLKVGGSETDNYNYNWIGTITRCAVYNRTLSADEISAFMS